MRESMEGGAIKESANEEERLFGERADFIRENYPIGKSRSYEDVAELINDSLDGFTVIEQRDKGRIVGLRTYTIEKDAEGASYCRIGLALVDPEYRGLGISSELLEQLKNIARENGCEYMTANADTDAGQAFMEKAGFDVDEDPVNGREYYRYDL